MLSALRGFSVARLPLDSKTTNLPFPLIPPANDSAAELDSCASTESTCPRTVPESRFKVIITKRKVRRSVTKSLREPRPNYRDHESPIQGSPKQSILCSRPLFCNHMAEEMHKCRDKNSLFDAPAVRWGCHFTDRTYRLT